MTILQQQQQQKTTSWQAFIHLLKGYVGPGCLSLPWAVSQLGLPLGVFVIFSVSYWTSMNIWHVVQLKREYEKSLSSSTTNSSSTEPITYPDVGQWLYGKKFGFFLKVMICIQQIAVCTVFLSFIGENLGAAIRHNIGQISHVAVITLVLPASLGLVCIPNLKILAPIMTVATVTLFGGFAVLGVLIYNQWENRPEQPPVQVQDWNQLPISICAILYSFEGICLILPIEGSMANKESFSWVFAAAMTVSAIIFALVASLCVMAFGPVSSGSITAFLVEQAPGDDDLLNLLYSANTLVSVAVLLTYPLQLFPSYELVGPSVAKYFTAVNTTTSSSSSSVNSHDHVYVAANEEEPTTAAAATTTSPTAQTNGELSRQSSMNEEPFVDEPEQDTSHHETMILSQQQRDDEEFDYWHYFGTSYGDTPAVRAGLVIVTYLFAIIIPNVQLLVSLAGAVSGSVTGLLVPPLLQLAHWKQLERQEIRLLRTSTTTTSTERGVREGGGDGEDDDNEVEEMNMNSTSNNWGSWDYQRRRLECYILFLMGSVVLIIGTVASMRDIIRVYMGLDNDSNAVSEN